MSQTMATKHIAALEVRLGASFAQDHAPVTLTEAGRAYLDAVERILGEVDDADAEAAAGAVEVRGTLRLNAPFSFGIREVAPLIPGFLRNHPALTIDLGLNDRQVDLIEEGWDLAVRIGDMVDLSLIARLLAPCHTVIRAAPRYLTGKATPRTIADLAPTTALAIPSQSTGVGRWLFGSDRKTSVTVSGSLKANNGDALVAAAVAGRGELSTSPHFSLRAKSRRELLVPYRAGISRRLLNGWTFSPSIRRNRRSSPAKVRAFIDFLAKTLRTRARMGPHLPVCREP